jgi:cysteine desulfurase / selenocysteine lyase
VTAARLGDRSLFPSLEPFAYLNHAGVSPPSEPVREAVQGLLDDLARRGGAAIPATLERAERLRGRIAELLSCRPADVALTGGTTAGIQAVALCLAWRPGDRVVLLEGEFPANVTPWQQAARAFGVEVAWVPLDAFLRSTEEGLARLDAELARGARLVAVSAVQFRSGLRMPVAEMAARCAAAGAEIFVDAVQAAGVVPLEVRGVDYLAGGGHKWLTGTVGAGYLYVRPERLGSLVPRLAGWLSHEDPARFLVEGPGLLRHDRPIRARADFLEGGSASDLSRAALLAALEILLGLGIPAVQDHVGRYLDRLEPALRERGFRSLRAPEPARRSGILSVEPPPGHAAASLARGLRERGVACATPDGALRLSPHWSNHEEEIPRLLRALDEAMGRG